MRPLTTFAAAVAVAAVAAAGCGTAGDTHGFVTRLGRDTVAVERIVRRGDTVTLDGVDRWPRVRRRHAVLTLRPDGAIATLAMDIREPSAPAGRVERHVEAQVRGDSTIVTSRDSLGTVRRAFATGDGLTMPHVSQMYGLTELYVGAALRRGVATHVADGDSVHVQQFYVDREFDTFPLHEGWVQPMGKGDVRLWHDWLSGVGALHVDSAFRMQSYSGAGTTYKVDVVRVDGAPDVDGAFARLAADEKAKGAVTPLSVRDTARGTIGTATFWVDYGRPLARGRVLLGDVIPYGYVWRTGANAATQFHTSAPITIGSLKLAAGTYTLWSVAKKDGGATLIVNAQTGQWGTNYDAERDIGEVPLTVAPPQASVEKFTVAIEPTGPRAGMLTFAWGTFKWSAPIALR